MSSSAMAMFSLEGQTALVTGGTRGIGQAAAIALAEAGADIILIQVYFPISYEIELSLYSNANRLLISEIAAKLQP